MTGRSLGVLLVVVVLSSCGGGGSSPSAGKQATSTTKPDDTAPATTDPLATTSTDRTDPSTTTERPGTTAPREVVGLPSRPPPLEPVTTSADAIATSLAAEPSCDQDQPDKGLVTFTWAPSGNAEQLVAFTARKDGFETNAYNVSDPLGPTASSHTITGLQAGGLYYWRILTRHDSGWAPTTTQSFTGPTCVAF